MGRVAAGAFINKQPKTARTPENGDVAQLGERGLCKPEVVGSSPIISTNPFNPISRRIPNAAPRARGPEHTTSGVCALQSRAKRGRRRRLYGVGSSPIISTNPFNVILRRIPNAAPRARGLEHTTSGVCALQSRAKRGRRRRLYGVGSSPIISTNPFNVISRRIPGDVSRARRLEHMASVVESGLGARRRKKR